MANFRKEMMFNLLIKPPKKEGRELAFHRKIRGGPHLMLGPGFFDIPLLVGRGKLGSFHNMCQLKNESHYQSLREVKRQKADNSLPPGDVGYQYRQHQKQEIVDRKSTRLNS